MAVVVGGSALGVLGWHLLSNRNAAPLDTAGFDLASAPQSQRTITSPAVVGANDTAKSGLRLIKTDVGIRIPDAGGTSPSGAKAADAAQQARLNFTSAVRKNEGAIRRFAERMTKKYPMIRQYGRDWMSHPDLKKLNDDYMRDHDPVKFMRGLAKSDNFGRMVKKYAGAPEIREFIIEGVKAAPAELLGAATDALQNDRLMKDMVSGVVKGIGLPPGVTALIGGNPASPKVDQEKIMSDIMKDPALSGQKP